MWGPWSTGQRTTQAPNAGSFSTSYLVCQTWQLSWGFLFVISETRSHSVAQPGLELIHVAQAVLQLMAIFMSLSPLDRAYKSHVTA